jgi:hypothetical protein
MSLSMWLGGVERGSQKFIQYFFNFFLCGIFYFCVPLFFFSSFFIILDFDSFFILFYSCVAPYAFLMIFQLLRTKIMFNCSYLSYISALSVSLIFITNSTTYPGLEDTYITEKPHEAL